MTSKLRVLVVDDSAFMRSLITRLIKQDERFEVVGKATNGREAIDRVKELKPDLVTMDIEMPEMNGLEALGHIMRETPVPVIMLSSLTEAGARETMKALELGAIDFMPKAMQDAEQSLPSQGKLLTTKLWAASRANKHHFRRQGRVPVSGSVGVGSAGATAERAAPTGSRAAESRPLTGAKGAFKAAQLLLIGSSTGGPRALHEFIPKLPGNLRVPVVITQHMPANFTAAMAARLNELSPLTITEGRTGDVLMPGHVYVAPGGSQTRVKSRGGQLVLDVRADQGESVFKPSVEVMAASVGEALQGNVLAVMLTGMGSDGAMQFMALRQQGAYILAQDEATCVVYGMPRAVVDLGAADEVLPLEKMAETVQRLLA